MNVVARGTGVGGWRERRKNFWLIPSGLGGVVEGWRKTQITHQACEEGWSFIAEWTGVPLSYVMNLVGVSEKAKFAVFWPYDGSWDSLDLPDAFHAQTFLAYNVNGADLPADHGAPLRVRLARQLGSKSVKYLQKITLVDSMKHVGDGRGSSEPAAGYSLYAGVLVWR